MDFSVDEGAVDLAAAVAEFFERRGDAAAIAQAATSGAALDRSRWLALCDMGLPAARIDEPRGMGLTLLETTLLAEQLGAVLLPEPATATMALARACSKTSGHDEFLDAVLDGTRVFWVDGFAAAELSAAGRVSGQVHASPVAAFDGVAVVARTPDPKRRAILVVHTRDLPTLGDVDDVDPARPVVAHELNEVAVGDVVEIDVEAAERLWRETTLLSVAELVGGMQATLTGTVRYVREREQFGRSIGSFQAVKHQLADMYVSTEQARAAVQFAAIGTDAATGDVDAMAQWVLRAAITLFDNAIHLHGAMGFAWEVDVHLHLRRALALRQQFWHTSRSASHSNGALVP